MATGPMYKVPIVVTGVANAPYYLNGYFAASGGTAQQAATAWQAFWLTGIANLPAGSTWANTGQVETIDPINNQVTGSTAVTPASQAGTNGNTLLPSQNQFLFKTKTGVYVNGRQVQGRVHGPCPYQADCSSSGTTLPFVRTSKDGGLATLIADPNSVWSVFSRPTFDVLGALVRAGFHTPVATAFTGVDFGVLRSRR